MEITQDPEAALRQHRQRFDLVLNGSDKLAIQGYTADGTITFWNRASEVLYGYSSEEAVGKNILDLLHTDETRAAERAIMDRILDTGVIPPPEEIQIRTSTGQLVWIYCNRMLIQQSGQLPEFFCFDIDITERKQSEAALQTIQRLESLGILAGGIAHDFNNILTAIFGNIELAMRQLDQGDKARQPLLTASQAIDKAVNLTRKLLTFSKGDAPEIEEIDLRELLQETAHFNLSGSNIDFNCNIHPDIWLINNHNSTGMNIHCHINPELWSIKGDYNQLERVFANIIINARDAMPGGGTLHITADNITVQNNDQLPLTPGAYVCICIRDKGCGIDNATLTHIFEPFFTTKPTGQGLGLSIAHSIISKHKGHIQVESASGAGTTFYVWLPATEVKHSQNTPDTSLQRGSGTTPLRILILDDDEMICGFASAALEMAGHQVTISTHGDDTLSLYHQSLEAGQPFDIVILDLTIRGGLGGLATARLLLDADPAARLIVSSGYSHDTKLADYQQYGFCGRLPKPFRIQDLLDEVARVCSL